jgi:thioredoxin-related protein
MKKIILLLILVFTVTLTSCEETDTGLDYSAFSDKILTSYSDAEDKSHNKYILYYYSETCSYCNDIKQEILTFFQDFELLDYYLLDVGSDSVTDTSQFTEFTGTPSLFFIADGELYDKYVGTSAIRDFIAEFSDKELDYIDLAPQYITNFNQILINDDDAYLVYYYNDECEVCELVKSDFLNWAYKRNPMDVYFVNKSAITDQSLIPEELLSFSDDQPVLAVMSNGDFTDVYYQGQAEIITYINTVDMETLTSVDNTLDYSDFETNHLDNYNQTLVVSNDVHFEYFYSKYCSHCASIKTDVLSFFDGLEDVPFYMIDVNEIEGTNTIDELEGVPFLAIVANNMIVETYAGSLSIPAFIESYLNGDIDLTTYE